MHEPTKSTAGPARRCITRAPAAPPGQAAESRPFYAYGGTRLYAGEATALLRTMDDASVDCIVTSPPYYRLRDYGTGTWSGGNSACDHNATLRQDPNLLCADCGATFSDQQIGLEETVTAYVRRLREVFQEGARVLAPHGTCWINLGDSYSGTRSGPPRHVSGRAVNGRTPQYVDDVLPKNLLGVPWRVAFALQADGWTVRNAVVWHKPNAFPSSVRDRVSNTYELIFLMVRSQRYWFDLDSIRAPYSSGSIARYRHAFRRKETVTPNPRGKNPGDVWTINTESSRIAHTAQFPLGLPTRAIAAGCPPWVCDECGPVDPAIPSVCNHHSGRRGVVLDPFQGVGGTALAADVLGRDYLGFDLNPAFLAATVDRLAESQTREATDPA